MHDHTAPNTISHTLYLFLLVASLHLLACSAETTSTSIRSGWSGARAPDPASSILAQYHTYFLLGLSIVEHELSRSLVEFQVYYYPLEDIRAEIPYAFDSLVANGRAGERFELEKEGDFWELRSEDGGVVSRVVWW